MAADDAGAFDAPSTLGEGDRAELARRGIPVPELARQVALLRAGTRPARLARACTVGDGIVRLDEEAVERLALRFERAVEDGRVTKLVPASGASTRMWKSLQAVRAGSASPAETKEHDELLRRLDELPFLRALDEELARRGTDRRRATPAEIVDALVGDGGLGYAQLPKGLIPFHRDQAHPDGARTPLEEHLREAKRWVRDRDGRVRVHFTVSPEHEPRLRALIERLRPPLEADGARLDVTFSTQRPSSDTVALDATGALVRTPDGHLLFRPGGHGALLLNLRALADAGGDLVFLRNIDNVQPDARQAEVVRWERAIGGLLVELEERTFAWLQRLGGAMSPEAADDPLDDEELASLAAFVRELGTELPPSLAQADAPTRLAAMRRLLERPLRVCAMVPNTGEPGGGPFWVRGSDGTLTLQLVESAQIDKKDAAQKAIADAATHFNPTDLACAIRDVRGRPHDLARHVDHEASFVSEKSLGGRPIRVLEWPGLWNGSMADWSTVFVEAPIATFAPVKTVLDLLRPEHG